jgi:hypothetical protein
MPAIISERSVISRSYWTKAKVSPLGDSQADDDHQGDAREQRSRQQDRRPDVACEGAGSLSGWVYRCVVGVMSYTIIASMSKRQRRAWGRLRRRSIGCPPVRLGIE